MSRRRRPGARILIIDDDPALLEALPEAVHLRMDAIDIDTCDSAAAAVERIEAADYDAIVSDIKCRAWTALRCSP